jgi:hypothetical protein
MKHQIETDAYAQDIQKMIEANKCNWKDFDQQIIL